MCILVRALLIVTLALPFGALANTDLLAHQDTVEAKVFLRGWNQKGFGDQIGVTKITVITAPDLRGDIVILRWNEESTFFTTEVYKQDESLTNLRSWKPID